MSAGTLAHINGESLAVPGLAFRGRMVNGKIAIVCSDSRGAAELWHFAPDPKIDAILGGRLLGGVEKHSPVQVHDFMPDPIECDILGGPCWADGTSLGFDETFAPLIAGGNSQAVLRELANWHASWFGGDA